MSHCVLNMSDIVQFQQNKIISWKKGAVELEALGFFRLVEENHFFNYQLWHAEDRARREDQGTTFVYKAKREIDHFNQQRNNRMEAMDVWLLNNLKPAHFSVCPLHSESPGMIIDRLSILSLKIYHMNDQVLREDVDKEHSSTCLEKLHTLKAQQNDLKACFEQLIKEVIEQTRTFKVYYQLKMYNDPKLNPELYSSSNINES